MRHTAESLPPTLRRPLRAVRRRIRLQRALDGASHLAVAGLGFAAVVLVLDKTGGLAPSSTGPLLLAAAAAPLLGSLLNGLRPVPHLLAAQLLDRAHGLRSRVSSALELSAVPADQRSPFARAAIADAEARAAPLSPSRAFPLRAPRTGGAVAALAAGVAVLGVMTPPPPPPAPAAPDGMSPLLLHADDLEAFDSELERILPEREGTPSMMEAAAQYNQLLEDLADRRIDRSEALRRIAAIERHLTTHRAPDRDALDRSLRDMGEQMRHSKAAEDTSRALREGDAATAERKMRELAEDVRTERMSRKEIQRLRQDLERASKARNEELERQRQELERRRDETERLLQRRREEQDQQSPQRQRLLEKRQRELERLRREHQQMREQQRQLERLQRELEKAAEELNDGRSGDAADSLDRGAEDLNRMARQRMGEQQMQRMAEQLEQLREMIRRQRKQQGAGGERQAGRGQGQGQERMERFVLRARGEGEGGAPLLMPGQDGSDGQRGGRGRVGDGDGDGQGQGEGQGDARRALQLGGGEKGDGQRALLELPGMGKRRPGGQGDPDRGRGGSGPGRGGDPSLRGTGDDARLEAHHEDSRVTGDQAGEGPTRSEVIMGAADRGFVTRGYQQVHAEYRDHAEEVLEQDEVPPGYRFYVRRYFQLIRPREGQ